MLILLPESFRNRLKKTKECSKINDKNKKKIWKNNPTNKLFLENLRFFFENSFLVKKSYFTAWNSKSNITTRNKPHLALGSLMKSHTHVIEIVCVVILVNKIRCSLENIFLVQQSTFSSWNLVDSAIFL